MLTACASSDNGELKVIDTVSDTEAVTAQSLSPEESALPSPVEETTVTEPEKQEVTVSYTAVGDNLIHSSLYKQAARRGEASGMDYDWEYAYKNVADELGKADISIINQETLIANDEYEPDTYPSFNSPTSLGDHMAKLGFDVFGMANNHVLDKGEDGLRATFDYYDSRNMIRVGAYRNEEDREDLRTIEVDGVTTAFLGYTESLNGLSLPSDSEKTIGRINDEEDIALALSEVEHAAEQADIVIVLLHWGVEDSDEVTQYQRDLAKQFGNAGADVILGSHPHVLRNIDLIDNEDGSRTLCAYSLGNFISAQDTGRNLIGGILDFEITVSDEEKSIHDVEFIPTITHYDGSYRDIRLYKLRDYTRDMAENHGVKVSLGSRFGYDYIYEYLEKHHLTDYLKGEYDYEPEYSEGRC